MSQKGPVGDGLSRLKNVYRSRYVFDDGLQEPRDVDPGHNVLSAIKNCFEDTNSDDLESMDSCMTPDSIFSSKILNPHIRQPSTTHKSLKSSLRKSIVHLSSPQSTLSKSAEQVTDLEDLQRPQNAIDINNLLLPESGQTSKYSENSKKGNSEKNIHGNEGELFNTEQVIQTVNTPSVVRNLAKSFNETYIIDQSAVQQPFSPTLKLLPKKRLSFKFPKEPEISNIKKIKMSEKGDQKQSGVLNRTIDTKKDSVSSFTKKTAVNENSFLKAVQPVMTPVEQNIEDDEDEFMIAEVDSFALNSWISNPKKAESKRSTSVHYKKSEVVSEKPIAVKRSISVTNSLVHQDISSQKFPAECEKQTNFQKTLNKQFSPNKQQAKGSLAKRKGNLTYLSSPTETNSSNENPKQRTLFQKNADNQLGSVPIKQLELREGIHMIKVVSTPKSGHIPEILTGEAEKNLTPEVPNALDPLSPMFPSAFKNSPTVKSMHSFGSEQIDLETEMLENGSETESFTTLQHMKRSKKVNNILGSTTTPKSHIYSMFLQAATQGHAESRFSMTVPDPPKPDHYQQAEENDNEFIFDEAALIDYAPVISIPRKGKDFDTQKKIQKGKSTSSFVCTDSQYDVTQPQNKTSPSEQMTHFIPPRRGSKEVAALELIEGDSFVISEETSGKRASELVKDKNTNLAFSDGVAQSEGDAISNNEQCLQEKISEKQEVPKKKRGRPPKCSKGQNENQAEIKSVKSPANRNNSSNKEAVNTKIGSSEKISGGRPKRPKLTKKASCKMMSPIERKSFSKEDEDNVNITNKNMVSTPKQAQENCFKKGQKLKLPDDGPNQDLQATKIANQQTPGTSDQIVNTVCEQLESVCRSRISKPPSNWWVVTPSQLNITEKELSAKSKNKKVISTDIQQKKNLQGRLSHLPVDYEEFDSKVQHSSTKGNKQTKHNLHSNENYPEISAVKVSNSRGMQKCPNAIYNQDPAVCTKGQKIPKSILKRPKKGKKHMLVEESGQELTDTSEDERCLNTLSREQETSALNKIFKSCSLKKGFRDSISACVVDVSDESTFIGDNALAETSESACDSEACSVDKLCKTLKSSRKKNHLQEKAECESGKGKSRLRYRAQISSSSETQEDSEFESKGNCSGVLESGPAIPRAICLTTANKQPIAYDLNSSSSDSINEYKEGKQPQKMKIIPPSKTPNVRRSKRTKVKPLAYWKGERVNYKVRESGGLMVEGIVPPTEIEHPRKAVTKKPSVYKNRRDIPCVEYPKEGLDELANVLDATTGKLTQAECVRTSENCLYHNPNEPISICKSINSSTFSTGKLRIGPFEEKGLQFVCLDTVIFYIISGSVELTLQLSAYRLKAGDFFYVPPGNMYNIKNLINEDAILIFTQLKA